MSFETLLVGDLAPDFELPDTTGGVVHLYEKLERASVVLFFYVRNFTPVCMAEVCSFRDRINDFSTMDAMVFGISPGNEPATKRFADFHKLPFPLLIDNGNRVRNLYRVPKIFGFMPGRSTYVIGQDRKLLRATHAGFESGPHVTKSLEVLRSNAGR